MEYALMTQEYILDLSMDARCQIPPFYLRRAGLRVVDAGNGLAQWAGTEEEFQGRLQFSRLSNGNGNGH
jgi:hypothetical protein